ncbi:UDP-N-acetylmuramoyl-L-alanyl-D-glutamate--2,6-diaminopimelate ligase [Desulfuromonas acetoxidans]|uniref:UDP-N-acetylmuramoyl-L-alanyl-D-glutamate--2, 6-diaminopimelate ligase n=1 Tax=Desulfuromonas acetoxidans TaxID=891 RepID=UPI00292E31C4|nr:UDP-N-acetylmuramoyl-L-alanyl-D-glutamate--2,6-diaminopimelate ligase [Desulfuromonas acetoxidans]
MKLSQIVADVTSQGELAADVEISHLAYDSRCVRPGTLFFALRGVLVDGHDYAKSAVERGAVAVVVEQPVDLPDEIVQVVVDDSRYAMARCAACFYDYPAQGMLIVGVTGTNGKTTMTYLLESVLKQAGYTPAVVGTISNRMGDDAVEAEHTTPESLDLQRILAEFKSQGADALVIEVSSHALMQSRVVGLTFDVAVFTNLTPEHLDYHKNMESYFAAKTRLFKEPQIYGDFTAVVNTDDPYGAKLVRELNEPLSVGMHRGADVRVCDVEQTMQGTVATLETPQGEITVRSPLVGPFNLENLLCAVGAGLVLNLPITTIEQGLAAANRVPGRLEPVDNTLGALIVVDYAHTGDALAKALEAMAALKPQRIITVFGCGGDRDTLKRPAMGEVAGRYSDLSIVTSDNPRTENPAKIIDDIKVGIERICPNLAVDGDPHSAGKCYVVIEDRHEAIVYAVNQLRAGDLLLIAGKGHEDYQVIGTQKIHFDDREQVRLALEQRARREDGHESDQ